MVKIETVAHGVTRTGVRAQKRRQTPGRWTAANRATFLAALQETANVTLAAKAAGRQTPSAYALRSRDPEFRAAWAAALQAGVLDLELEMLERARKGVLTPVTSGGKVITSKRVFSERLGMFLLNRHAGALAVPGGGSRMRDGEASAIETLKAEIAAATERLRRIEAGAA